MSDVTNENLQVLLTKIMTDRFCSGEASDFEACIQNYVPQQIDSSWVDQSLQRKGFQKCRPYQEVAQKCLQDDRKQSAVLRAAAKAPVCNDERKVLAKCQRKRGQDCEREALEVVYCGMIYLVQRQKKSQQATAAANTATMDL